MDLGTANTIIISDDKIVVDEPSVVALDRRTDKMIAVGEKAKMMPDGRRLRAFDKVELQPGETKTMTFELKADDLAFVDWNGKWRLEEGDFKLMIADQSADIHCTDTYQWSTANR